ncbi:MAG TPA: MinD/ParA family protein [Polyangiales bacterium]|nr:MinD/ParA family protein [Polyangiales bacterium]
MTSGKGGVGKTQLSANIAHVLARRGQRVLLLDADLGLASLDLALGVHPNRDLLSVVRGQCELRDIVVPASEGLDLVPACPGRYEMANLETRERELLHTALQDLASDYDTLIIDTGAGIGTNSVAFASLGSEILLVTTPDPTSLRDAYAMSKVLHRRAGVETIRVIANQVASEAGGIEVFERLLGITRRFLSLELDYLGCVPRDESVPRAVAQGHPYVIGAPRSAATRAVESLVSKLIQRCANPDVVC